jgi:hypothetical protein
MIFTYCHRYIILGVRTHVVTHLEVALSGRMILCRHHLNNDRDMIDKNYKAQKTTNQKRHPLIVGSAAGTPTSHSQKEPGTNITIATHSLKATPVHKFHHNLDYDETPPFSIYPNRGIQNMRNFRTLHRTEHEWRYNT